MRLSQSQTGYSTLYTQSGFKKGKITCPVCGRTHHYHCSVTEDGGLALCKYKLSERQAKDGRFIHILNPDVRKLIQATPAIKSNSEVKLADADRLHEVYSTLLTHLRLSPIHGDGLLNERGLSDTTIAYNLYASVPDEAKGNRIARAMAKLGFDLRGVAGFYKRAGDWRLNTSVKGYYVPYRDEWGRIVGLQIRRDGNAQPKYLWLTSVDRPEGASSGSPLHFVKPDLANASGEIIVTEGALKADRISEFSDSATVALAGVNAMNPDRFTQIIRRALPNLKKLFIAFDIDWQDKSEVKNALLRLGRSLTAGAFNVIVREWDANYGKGLDDALYQQLRG